MGDIEKDPAQAEAAALVEAWLNPARLKVNLPDLAAAAASISVQPWFRAWQGIGIGVIYGWHPMLGFTYEPSSTATERLTLGCHFGVGTQSGLYSK